MSVAFKTHKFGGTGAARNTRELLMSFGLGSLGAQLAQQSVFFIPRTTDPDAQATIFLVEAVQYGLAEMGAPVVVTGILDEPTVKYLMMVSGPNWHGKSWAQLLDDLTRARQIGRSFRVAPSVDLGEYVELGGFDMVSVAALAVGGFLLYRACKR
jgi:hypothetical protein